MKIRYRLVITPLAVLMLCIQTGRGESSTPQPPAGLLAHSDSVQATIAQALATNDASLWKAIVPDELGIVWVEGQAVSGKEAKEEFDSLFMSFFGNAEMTTERESVSPIPKVEDYFRELVAVKIVRPVDDSTSMTYTGHFTNYWQRVDNKWTWQRLFVTTR